MTIRDGSINGAMAGDVVVVTRIVVEEVVAVPIVVVAIGSGGVLAVEVVFVFNQSVWPTMREMRREGEPMKEAGV